MKAKAYISILSSFATRLVHGTDIIIGVARCLLNLNILYVSISFTNLLGSLYQQRETIIGDTEFFIYRSTEAKHAMRS